MTFCTHCKRHGHYIGECRTMARAYKLPVPMGVVCSVCRAQGHHYTQNCPGTKFLPLRTRRPQWPCLYCEGLGHERYGHEVPTCWTFARHHGLDVPYWWKCGVCDAVGKHEVVDCPSLQAYLNGQHRQVIVFDLETTGLGKSPEIVEIAACPVDDKKEMFHAYVMPRGQIDPSASSVNHLVKHNGVLYKHGRRVKAVSAIQALDDFSRWLEYCGVGASLLVAHNCRGFDARVLLVNLLREANGDVRGRFFRLDVWFGDTVPLCKEAFPGFRVRLGDVYSRIFKRTLTNAHEAQADVSALVDILNSGILAKKNFGQHVFSVQDVAKDMGLSLK